MSVCPGQSGSATTESRPEPTPADGELLVQGLSVGVCGTDREVAGGLRGYAPPGNGRIILGHESLGRVLTAPAGSEFKPGDLIAGMVRRPDPQPCAYCARGECDSCGNGRYTSCGISGWDGYGAERWCIPPAYAVRVEPRLGELGVLTEPVSVLAKAWERIGAYRTPGSQLGNVLISGAGAMGMLAALIAVQRGYRTVVLGRRWPRYRLELVRRLGATPAEPGDVGLLPAPDVVVETTGVAQVAAGLADVAARNAVICMVGLGNPQGDATRLAPLLERLVTTNAVVFGTVNAAPRHYALATATLAASDPEWLRALITRKVPLTRWTEALRRLPGDVKVVVELTPERP
jgi:glucose 1-dehydrogenase